MPIFPTIRPERRGARPVIAAVLGLSLAALLTACGPGEEAEYGAASPGATEAGTSTSGKVSAELVGEWQNPSDYLILGKRNLDIYDPQTGWPDQPDDIRAGSGIRITADGRYVWSGYAATHISGSACHSRAMSYHRGTASRTVRRSFSSRRSTARHTEGGATAPRTWTRRNHTPRSAGVSSASPASRATLT